MRLPRVLAGSMNVKLLLILAELCRVVASSPGRIAGCLCPCDLVSTDVVSVSSDAKLEVDDALGSLERETGRPRSTGHGGPYVEVAAAAADGPVGLREGGPSSMVRSSVVTTAVPTWSTTISHS